MQDIKGLRRYLLLALAPFCLKAAAQDTLSLESAIATALQNNYDILISKNDSAVAAITYEYRNAAFLPRINANTTLLFNNNNSRQKLADGSERKAEGVRSTNINAALNLNWTVYDGGRMFILRDQLDQAVRLGNLAIKEQVIVTISDVMKLYYDIVRQQQQLRNIEEQMRFSEERLRLAEYKLDIGVGIKPDVLQARIDYNNRKAARLNQVALIDQRTLQLNQLMNVATAARYPVQDTIPVREDLVLGDFLGAAADINPSLQVARTNILLAEMNVQQARAARLPTVSVISAFNFNRFSNNTAVNPFTPLFNLNRGWNYGLTATIPILNNHIVRQQIRQAEQALQFQELRYNNREAMLATEISNSYRAYQAQKEVLAVAESNVALALENLHIETERYRLGRTTFIELRQAEDNVATARTNVINARYNLKVAEVDLMRLRGDLVR